jgi:hypothetical protein
VSSVSRLVTTALFAAVLAFVGAASGCASASGSGFTGGAGLDGGADVGVGVFGDGAPSGGAPIEGLASILLTPPSTSLTLQYPATTQATTQLTAEGSFMTGPMQNVTSQVSYSIDPPGMASVNDGLFASPAPGTFTITASAGSVTSNSVTVTVTLAGTVVGMGVTQADLDGTPGAGGAPTIAYPLDGALFPYQLGPIEFQVVPTSTMQTEARIAFEGGGIDLKVYEPCVPIMAPTIPNACTVTVPADLEQALDGASEGTTFTQTVRLSAPGGGMLAESMPISARWSSSQLQGGLYYWTTDVVTNNTYIMRYNLDTPGTPPEQYFTQNQVGTAPSDEENLDPPASNGSQQCFGCHAISLDGTKLGLTFGGSAPALFALVDVATKKAIATRLFDTDPNMGAPFATYTTFSPDGTVMVQAVQSAFYLRTADANLADVTPNPLFMGQTGTDVMTTPFWSKKGDLLAFTGWVPNPALASSTDPLDKNGDETPNSEIWIASVTGDMTFGTPTKLVPGVAGKSEYYPAVSDDSQFVVFDESSCTGPAAPAGEEYGGVSPCSGYDNASATLRMVSAKGGTPVYLTNASQNDTWTNSWPRFAPQHASFQGKSLYWIAFSSRHPYGATLPGTDNPALMDTEPQLWFAGVVVDASGNVSSDPSFAPVWLPLQNPVGTQLGNHSPQWVTKAVTVVF